ncbi:MAG: hypothetical protein H7A01_01090 [Hahellaceae bacterium]|nr:hypothetical protein [Hahellaceae bacterium]MCP5210897.1 hypothetical protein [Hahellaceae bacterium]
MHNAKIMMFAGLFTGLGFLSGCNDNDNNTAAATGSPIAVPMQAQGLMTSPSALSKPDLLTLPENLKPPVQ